MLVSMTTDMKYVYHLKKITLLIEDNYELCKKRLSQLKKQIIKQSLKKNIVI